jgi:hypothetical protein
MRHLCAEPARLHDAMGGLVGGTHVHRTNIRLERPWFNAV